MYLKGKNPPTLLHKWN